MAAMTDKNTESCEFCVRYCTFAAVLWYNPFYSIVQFRVTTLRYRPKEAVPIEPKQQRHISTDGVKTTAGATGQPGAPQNNQNKKKKPKKRRSIIGMILSFIGCMLCLCIMAGSVGGVLLSMYIVQVTADDAETLDLDNQKNKQTSIIYDRYSDEYDQLTRGENRIWRELSAMPDNLKNAVVAIEDKNFWTEPGINLKGTIGAALNAFTGNRIWGTNRGASTLEQQLIKNLTGDNEQDNMRKVREIFRALGLDNKYSKETILEAYLNTIPLTGIVHGMEAGSLEYFGKHVEDLTLSECAVLASITKNPTKYNPATNPEELIRRRNHVLYEMQSQGYITEAEFEAAKAETITLVESSAATENATRSSSNSWFTDALYNELLTQLQEDLNYTKDEAKELIFSGKVIAGTRAHKQRTMSFNAFISVNYPPIAYIRNDRIVRNGLHGTHQGENPVRFYDSIDPRVFVLKLTPGVNPGILDALADSYDAVILETFGIGGIPEFGESGESFQEAIFRWVNSGRTVVMTTQVPEEGLDLGVYEVGRAYADHPGILRGDDMTTETLVAKTMWALGQSRDAAEIQRLFYSQVNHDRIPMA